jgi:nucleoside-diphosphate-sugar epimerase
MAYCVITGVAGFIGSHLAEALLSEGHHVLGVDALTTNYDRSVKLNNLVSAGNSPLFTFAERKVEDLSEGICAAEGAYVFHLAGQPGVRDSWRTGFADYVQNNIVATQALLECLRPGRTKRLIFASSSSVYGAGIGRPMHESDHTAPLSPYGATKIAAEKLCLAYAQEYSIPTTILRFFSVYGPRQRPDMFLHILMTAARNGTPVRILGSMHQRRDFTYVGDIVWGCIEAMKMSEQTAIINLSSGTSVSLDQCITTIESWASRRISVIGASRQAGDPNSTLGDISKASCLLKYQPRTTFEEGLRRQWDWILSSTR